MKSSSDLWQARHVSISIERTPSDVYAFAAHPPNLPQWAAGLAGSVQQIGADWVADSPMGRVRLEFASANAFYVLDHDVTLPSGLQVHNPMRVLPNGGGSEVIFSVFRRPGMSEAELEADVAAVTRDLQALKRALEQ
jgi:hypothetical protein